MLDCFVCPDALFVGLTTVLMRDVASTVRPSRALAGQSKSPQIVTTDQSHQILEVSLCFIKKNTVKSLCRYEVIEENSNLTRGGEKVQVLSRLRKASPLQWLHHDMRAQYT